MQEISKPIDEIKGTFAFTIDEMRFVYISSALKRLQYRMFGNSQYSYYCFIGILKGEKYLIENLERSIAKYGGSFIFEQDVLYDFNPKYRLYLDNGLVWD